MKRPFTQRLRVSLYGAAAAGIVALSSCSSDEVIVKTADGVKLSAADLDKDPLRLLPGGALGVIEVDVPKVITTPQGQRALELGKRVLPVPPSANFVPERDVTRVLLGLYSFSGLDFSGVAVGNFDTKAIEKAAQGTDVTPLGTPLVRSQYSKWTIYVSANIGFCLLTSHTAVFGNETGIRRSLDRLERGDLQLGFGKELNSLLAKPGAPIAFGLDAKTDPQVAALAQQAAFLQQLELLRGVANLESPGLNVAATLTYPDAAAARRGKQSLESLGGIAAGVGFVQGLFGGRPLLRSLEAREIETSVQVQLALDVSALDQGLHVLETELDRRERALPRNSPSGVPQGEH